MPFPIKKGKKIKKCGIMPATSASAVLEIRADFEESNFETESER